MLLAGLVAAQLAHAEPLPLVGASICPRPAMVAERLAQLLPAIADEGTESPSSGMRARIEDANGGVVVTLENDQGTTLDQRRIEAMGTCDERAEAIAVMISSWLTELRHKELDPWPRRSPKSSQHLVRSSRVAWEGGAAFVASLAGRDFSPGARAHLELTRRGIIVAGRLEVFGGAARTVALGYGSASYTRVGAAIGPAVKLRAGRARFDLHASALLAATLVSGQDQPQDRSSTHFSPGISAGVSAGLKLGKATPFIDVGFAGWPRALTVVADGPLPSQATLPAWEVLLSVGVAIGTF